MNPDITHTALDYAIIVSEDDPAGMNIKRQLVKTGHFLPGAYDNNKLKLFDGHEVLFLQSEAVAAALFTLKRTHIYAENLDREIHARNFIFATTHSSAKKVHSLSVHTIGNWGSAEMGGLQKQICPVNPVLVRNLFLTLFDEWDKKTNAGWQNDYQVTLEATHHGPYLQTPTAFIEIGSDEEQWNDSNAGEVIAATILRILKGTGAAEKKNVPVAFGLGGTHYCSNFNKKLLRNEVMLSHVCPKYALEHFDEEMLRQCLERTTEPVDFALLDWKGLGKEKNRILRLLEDSGIEAKRTR